MNDINNIFPDEIVRTRGSDGTSYTSNVYSFETWKNLGFISILLILLTIAILGPVISVVFLILYAISIDKRPIILPIIGLLISAYILVDMSNGWILSRMMSPFFNPQERLYMLYLNGGLVITNIILTLIGYEFYVISAGNKLLSFLYIAGITLVSYHLFEYLFVHKIINII